MVSKCFQMVQLLQAKKYFKNGEITEGVFKALATIGTHERPTGAVNHHVNFEVRRTGAASSALGAKVLLMSLGPQGKYPNLTLGGATAQVYYPVGLVL